MDITARPAPTATKRAGAVDHNGLEILARHECLALLSTNRLGRVAVSMRALPVILPVRYALLGEDIVFRTGDGTRLGACAEHAVVAFEADHVDPSGESAWSVCVTGMAWELRRPDELRLAGLLPLEPLPASWMDHFVRIRSDVVSGRRLHPSVAPATATSTATASATPTAFAG